MAPPHFLRLQNVYNSNFIHSLTSFIAEFSQLCGRLAVFRGEFWSVKFIENLFKFFFDI